MITVIFSQMWIRKLENLLGGLGMVEMWMEMVDSGCVDVWMCGWGWWVGMCRCVVYGISVNFFR